MWRRYDGILGPDPRNDIRAELRFHIDCKTEDLIAGGWRPEAARREAERQFGNMLAVQYAGERIGERMERRRRISDYYAEWLWDTRYTLRSLRNNLAFTAVAILVLALGVGLNAAVFSVVNTMLLRPLPFPQSQQLVWLTGRKKLRCQNPRGRRPLRRNVYRRRLSRVPTQQSILPVGHRIPDLLQLAAIQTYGGWRAQAA